MAASAMTPKLLGRISNKEYQEKDKWKIDDIAFGPANELLISGHNLEIPKTFISVHKEDSGKYGNRPEYNRNFRQPQSGEQLVLCLEDSSIIGLKVESALRMVSMGDLGVLKTLKWKRSPACLCFYKGKLYAASSSTNIVSVYKLDLEDKSDIFLSDMRNDCVLEMVVVMENIYVCTKVAGRALVFSMTGSKEMEFQNGIRTDAMAMSICIHERTEVVFVSWSNFQIRLYSQETGKCLSTFDMTEELHKIRVTTENILVTLSASKCIVAVYDVGEAIKFGEFQNTKLSSVKKKNQKKLISHDIEKLESHPADFETYSFPPKPASKQSKVEKLRDTKELYMKQPEENENLRKQYDRDVQKLQERIKELQGIKNELISQQKTLKDNMDEEKGKVEKEIEILRHEKKELEEDKDAALRQKEQLKREMEDEKTKGEINKQVYKQVLASQKEENLNLQKEKEHLIERLSTRESEATSQGEVIEIDEFEKKKLLSVEKTHREKSMSHDEENLKDHPANSETNTSIYFPSKSASKQSKVEKLRDTKELYLKQLVENENLRRKSDGDIQRLNERIKHLEGIRTKLESQQKEWKDNFKEEKGKIIHEERSHFQNLIAKNNDSMKSSLLQVRSAIDNTLDNISENSIKVNRLESVQMEQNNKDLERRKRRSRSRRRTREIVQSRCSTENMDTSDEDIGRRKGSRGRSLTRDRRLSCSPEMQSRYSTEKMDTSDEDIGRRKGSRGRSLTRDRRLSCSPKMPKHHSTENLGTPVQRRQKKDFTTGPTTDNESTSGYETANVSDLERILRPGSATAAKLQHDEPCSTTDPANENKNFNTKNNDLMKSSLLQLRSVIDKTLDSIDEHQSILINQLDSVQGEKNNEDLERRTSSIRTHRESRLLPKDVPSYPDGTSDTNACKGDSDEEEFLDGKSKLEVCASVSVEGANLQIADTGVSLSIPPGALSEEQTILMKIIPQPCDAQDALKFECNSVVVVELLPNNCRFQCPVSLTLPHCLQLKEEYERNSIDVLISHHEEGFKPKWEMLHNARFNLCEENCTIFLHSFCWVTYQIHDTIVEAKRIKLYTAGKNMRLKDRITEVEVGFYPDLPGSGKILELNKDMHLSQRKPYVFLKTGEEPLLINLHKVVPKQWNNSQPDENPKIIPFDSVSISEERSCPFVLERSGDDTDIPLCIFKVGQKGRNEVELTIRPEILTT